MEKNSRNRNRNRGFQYPPSSISYQFWKYRYLIQMNADS
jgi:hypothetical protein